MVSYIKGGMQAKGIWKQDPEANIWMRMGSGEDFTICVILLIYSGDPLKRLRWAGNVGSYSEAHQSRRLILPLWSLNEFILIIKICSFSSVSFLSPERLLCLYIQAHCRLDHGLLDSMLPVPDILAAFLVSVMQQALQCRREAACGKLIIFANEGFVFQMDFHLCGRLRQAENMPPPPWKTEWSPFGQL